MFVLLDLHKRNVAGIMGFFVFGIYCVIALGVCIALTKLKLVILLCQINGMFPFSIQMFTLVTRMLMQRGAMTPMEVCEGLGLYDLTNRVWHIQGTCALKGDGLYEGLDWLATTLDEMRASGRITSASSSAS